MTRPVIYEIRQIGAGKVYVGSTNSWKRRLGEHRSALRSGKHCNKHLQAAWAKYGEEDFEFSVLEFLADVDQIVEREQHWIDSLCAATLGFNMCPAAGTTRGLPCSPERAARISAAKLGHIQRESTKALIRAARAAQVITPESIAKTRAGNTGKKRTAEFADRISQKLTGITRSPETRAKVAAANLGKKASVETRTKMSVSASGKERSSEHRAALAKAMTGRKLSPETIAKRQATRRANQEAAK
jgi:group I intron endonuclease